MESAKKNFFRTEKHFPEVGLDFSLFRWFFLEARDLANGDWCDGRASAKHQFGLCSHMIGLISTGIRLLFFLQNHQTAMHSSILHSFCTFFSSGAPSISSGAVFGLYRAWPHSPPRYRSLLSGISTPFFQPEVRASRDVVVYDD